MYLNQMAFLETAKLTNTKPMGNNRLICTYRS